MSKKVSIFLLVTLLVFTLGGCASMNLPGTSSSSEAANANQTQGAPDMSNQPVESKLAIGTLSLEGTDKAVTAEQAKALLPLWKAVKSLSSNTSASTDEINALYKQIQEAMTAEQVQAIKDMQLTTEQTQALMTKYNLQMPVMPTLDPSAQATRKAARASSGNTGGGGPGDMGGGMPGGGAPGGGPGDMGGGIPGGGQSGQPSAQGTPQAGGGRTGGRMGGGINTLFVDPLITLLQERAG